MLILGVDTSGKNGGIALVRFQQSAPKTLEVVPIEGGTFSAQLVPQIFALLSRQHFKKTDIDGFAIVSGPGSFTGLRVGLAAIKALAEILQKPIAAVSSLEAVARVSGRSGEIVAALDAGRGEVYVADFSIAAKSVVPGQQRLISLAELASRHEVEAREIVTPNEKLAEVVRQGSLRVYRVEYPKPDFIATIGFEKIQSGDTVSSMELDANYIRRSDAEITKMRPPG